MSDATSPTVRSTSLEAELRSTDSSLPDSSGSDVYPFLVHSQHSIRNGAPPEVDEGKLARQKRKRTSPEDQATLEAEYNSNPKPDKAARAEILKKVSLGEKEVQIWFQNRRQNTRRKTRPLLPHEIAAFGLGGMATLSSVPVHSIVQSVTGGTGLSSSTCALEFPNGNQERCGSSDCIEEIQRVPASPISRVALEQTNENPDTSTSTTKLMGTQIGLQSLLSSECLPAALGYISNRRNTQASSLIAPSSSAISAITEIFNSNDYPSSCPERISEAKICPPSSSQVRLSLSLDGKAELVSSQVSPPRPQRTRALSSASNTIQVRSSLKRCQSDIPYGHVSGKYSSRVPVIPKISSGRSRDARTWEFCCDTDARDELTTQAEHESSGSAVAAISLLRSTSTSNLKSSGSKRNTPAPKTKTTIQGKKQRLGRTSSSLARLQGSAKDRLGSPSGDSDKENWLPQDVSSISQRHQLVLQRPQKQKRRRVLEESRTDLAHASALSGSEIKHGKPSITEPDIFEDPMNLPKLDHEVNRFMRGEVSPSKKGDLDCIQGLLSLSQGTWR